MRVDTLPAPGVLGNGYQVRHEAAKAISQVEITARATPGGKTQGAVKLKAFFDACSTALTAMVDSTAPTISGAVVTRTSATTFTVVFTESMSQLVLPAASTFTIPSRVVTTIAWTNATTLTITVTAGAVAGDVVTYTAPALNAIQDLAGNVVATGSKASV